MVLILLLAPLFRKLERRVTFALFLFLAAFLYTPEPQLSDSLQQWKDRGSYFTFKQHQVFYTVHGNNKSAETVVCLHGFPSFSYDWVKVMPDLEARFSRIITLDFLGFGFSDKPTDHIYSIFEQADIVEALLGHLKVTKTHILAHDYGDTVGQELLYRYEQKEMKNVKITSMALLNGGVFPETNHPRLIQKVLALPYIGSLLSRLTFYRVFRKGFSEIFGPETQPSPQELRDFWHGILWNGGHKVMGSLLGYIAERRNNTVRWVQVLKTSPVPVHMIYGPADPVNPPAFIEHYRRTVRQPASITVLQDSVGHYPQWEVPGSCVKDYLNFITRVAGK